MVGRYVRRPSLGRGVSGDLSESRCTVMLTLSLKCRLDVVLASGETMVGNEGGRTKEADRKWVHS